MTDVVPASADRLSPALIRIALVAGLGSLILNLGTTTLNVALDSVIHDLDTTLSVAQWAVTGFLLSLTLVLPTFRWMTERVGMKRLYIASLVGYTATSLLCAGAWSIESLIVFRIAQGAIGGLLTPIAQALTARHAHGTQMGRLLSIVAIPVLVAPLLGPLVGGLLVQVFSWRAIFLFNVPVGVLCAAMCARVLPRDEEPPDRTRRLDITGLALLSPGLALFVYGISSIRSGSGSGSPDTVIACFGAAAVSIAAFVVHARRAPGTALLDLRLFRNSTVRAALGAYVLTSFATFGAQLVLPLYYQQVRGQTPMGVGLLLAPQGIGMLLTMPRVGRLTDRYAPGRIVIAGVSMTLLGTVAFCFASETTSLWLLSLSLVVRGAGLGASNNPTLTAVYRSLPKSEVANATTALNVVQRMGAPLGTVLLAVILAWRTSAASSLSSAFAQAFVACLVLNALTIIPALFLVRDPRTPRSNA
ncbi:MAG: Multidrug resistance protein [Myxococcales bacterium]|nr:Multidrug resistance protein [Myxococcales bacterium]